MNKVNATLSGLIFFLASSFFACKNVVDDPDWINTHPVYKDSVELQKKQTKIFLLDSATALKHELFEYVEKDNVLASYNSNKNEMVFFDYGTTQLITRIKMEKAGIRHKGNGVMMNYSFHAAGFDSLFFIPKNRASWFSSTAAEM